MGPGLLPLEGSSSKVLVIGTGSCPGESAVPAEQRARTPAKWELGRPTIKGMPWRVGGRTRGENEKQAKVREAEGLAHSCQEGQEASGPESGSQTVFGKSLRPGQQVSGPS